MHNSTKFTHHKNPTSPLSHLNINMTYFVKPKLSHLQLLSKFTYKYHDIHDLSNLTDSNYATFHLTDMGLRPFVC